MRHIETETFTTKLAGLCPRCELICHNASQDAAKKQLQADAALTDGAEVLVRDPVEAAAVLTGRSSNGRV